jgi:N-acetyltransferase 10
MQSYSIVRCCPSCLSRLSSSFFGSFYPPGLDAIHYEEHLDYEVLQSTHADLNKAVVRVNLFKEHRQTVQYVEPHDCARLAQVSVQ